jgi:TonB family protein
LRVGGEVKAPVVVRRISPNFESVRNVSASGVPIFEVLVSASGEVGDIRVLKSASRKIDAVIIDALKQWQFSPATLYGEPVAVYFVMTVNIDRR